MYTNECGKIKVFISISFLMVAYMYGSYLSVHISKTVGDRKIVPLPYLNMKNREDETPEEKFKREHKDLQKEGEKWMKDTANYCMIVATLVTTVVFAAAFTVPGGTNQDTGNPYLLEKYLV